ncbi:hypothetical protein L218DRAFT_956747 [Marasmius fiardii PR-910]|nr:hypothetical protein L218DRAFT_956747 [Marasmius fiardii PR-910]
MDNGLTRNDKAFPSPLLSPRRDFDTSVVPSPLYAHPLQDPKFSRLPTRTFPALVLKEPLRLSSSLSPRRNPRLQKQFPEYQDREPILISQHTREFSASVPSPHASNYTYLRPNSNVQHIYNSPASASGHGLSAKTHIHSPYRSSRLNPNNPPNTGSLPTNPYPVLTRLPLLPPSLHLPRPNLNGYSRTVTSESVGVPLTSLASLSHPSNNRLAPQTSVTLRDIPTPGDSIANPDYHSRDEFLLHPDHQRMNQENIDPKTRMNTFQHPQAQEHPSTRMLVKIEAPVPVRYHDIAVQSLKMHAASMNNDVGFLRLLNENGFKDSVGVESGEVGGMRDGGCQSKPWASESALDSLAEIALGELRKEEGEEGKCILTGKQDAGEQIEGETATESNSESVLTDRINSYGGLKLASPDTLIALTEPFLFDWCYDQQMIDRLAGMPDL